MGYFLRLTNRSIRRLQEAHGIDLYGNGLADIDLKVEGTAPFIKIYWAARLHEEPEFTLEEAAEETDELTPGELIARTTAAVQLAYGIGLNQAQAVEAASEGEEEDKSG